MNDREQNIIKIAKGFRDQSSRKIPLDEATIDANFLFRFEVVWCKWVSNIRGMMWSMIGESSNEPLSSEDGTRWLIHLDANPGVVVGLDITPSETKFTVTTSKGDYRCCFDKELQEKYNVAIKNAIRPGGDTTQLQRLHEQVWGEANQTAKIQDEIRRLAYAYQLIPINEEEALKYPPTEIRKRFQIVVNWVIWGEIAPSFLWPKTILRENQTDKKIRRTIRPDKWSTHNLPTTKPRIRVDTRIRTWTIYYLTRRGGGQRTEQSAVNLWNEEFSDTLDLRNYKSERDRLLKHGSEKGVN